MEGEAVNLLEEYKVGSLPTLFYIPNFISDSEQTQLINHIYQSPISKWKSLKNRRLQNWGGVVHEKGLLPQALPLWLTTITQRICEKTGLFPSAINHVLINEYLPNQGIMYGDDRETLLLNNTKKLKMIGSDCIVYNSAIYTQQLDGLYTVQFASLDLLMPKVCVPDWCWPHQDGPLYFPVVAILSLGSHAVMNFTPHSRLKVSSNKESSDTNANSDILKAENEDACPNHHDCSSSVLLMPCSLLIFKDNAYSDYLHGIEDSVVHQLDKAVNVVEALKHRREVSPSPGLEGAIEATSTEEIKTIQRTGTRISLTCRLVLKVHRNLFKF